MSYTYPGAYGKQPPYQIQQVKTGTAWDINAGNPFGQNFQGALFKAPGPTTGSAFTPGAAPNLTAGGGLIGAGNTLQTGSSYTPANQGVSMNAGGGLIGPGNTLQTGTSYAPPPGQDVPMVAGGGLVGPGNMPTPAPMPTYTPPTPPGPMDQFNFTYQDYMNDPGYQFMLDEGMRAINARASARGLLGSTGTDREALRYATGLASQYYNDAFNRFDTNRNFAANRYDTAFSQDWVQKMFDADMWKYMTDKEFENFWRSDASYNDKMAAKAARDAGLASVGQDSAGKAVELATNTAAAIASLSTSLAMFQAMAAQGKGEADAGLIDSIIGGITSFIGDLVKR
jgi:hypothetical protein